MIAFIFGGRCDNGISRAHKKMTDLFESLDLLNIHDDVHPAIIDELSLVVETHFILESRHPLQTHFILEEANDCYSVKMKIQLDLN